MKLLTADDLADRWQVPKTHIYRLARDGRLPVVRIGRYFRFSVEQIEQFERDGGITDPNKEDTNARLAVHRDR